MTRGLHLIAGFIIWLLFAVMGGALIYANGLQVEEGLLGAFYICDGWYPAMGVGGIMVLLATLYLVTLVPYCPKVRFITFDSSNGSVSISINAVRDYIRKLGEEFGAVVNIEPKIRAEKKLISIDLDVKLQTGARIPELSQALQDRVRDGLRDNLGITDIRDIKVRIQEIVGTPLPSRRRG